jgi:hypothetical protein
MKIKYLIIFFFLYFAGTAQITNLNKLSSGRLYATKDIKDVNNNIKGYFLLFENDKVAKETYQLEYVILDENLTKVTSGTVNEMKFESFLIDAKKINVALWLNKTQLLIEFVDDFESVQAYRRYRILDVKTNKLSDPFIFNKDAIVKNPVFDRKMKNYLENESEAMAYYEGVGLMVNSRVTDKKTKKNDRYLAHYDDEFNQVWKYIYEDYENADNKSKRFKTLEYLKSDNDVIVMFNHCSKKNGTYVNDYTSLFIDAKTGKLIKEINFPQTDKYAYKVADCSITDDKIYLLGNYSEKSEFGNTNDTENLGLFEFVFDKTTGKQAINRYLSWKEISGKLDVNEKGYVKKEGYMYIHNMLLLENDKIIVVAETFIQDPITTNNMYFFELSPKFTLAQVFEVTKFKNKFPKTFAHSSDIKKYGLFDFTDYQKLGDDEYLFYLSDNEKKSRNRKKSLLYGIVSYSGGQFKRQTLDLKTETSTIHTMNGKKGYLVLIEDFDEKSKPTEIRLEKINY